MIDVHRMRGIAYRRILLSLLDKIERDYQLGKYEQETPADPVQPEKPAESITVSSVPIDKPDEKP